MAAALLWAMVALSITIKADESDFRLPQTIFPTHYRIDLQPHFEDDNFTFYGQVWIDFTVKNDATQIVLHSRHLDIKREEVTVEKLDKNTSLDSVEFSGNTLQEFKSRGRARIWKFIITGTKGVDLSYELSYDMIKIKPSFPLKSGEKYRVYLKYKGQLSNTRTGFYKSSYLDAKTTQRRWLASSTFEPNEARRAFPCFDEPGFKAHFQVNLAHHDDVHALSNMPQHSSLNMTGKSGWVWSRFEETPMMSSYLVSFFVGKFESQETMTSNGKPFKVWSRPAASSQTQYALDIGPRILDFLSNLLGVPEPLPKQDILALPNFVADALENWGLISFGEKYLLYKEDVSPVSSRQQIAHTMAHELSHSWFGNMVSVKWWKNIWLNEGFATYFATIGANHIDPSWDTFSVTTVSAFLNVFSTDSLHSSHALTFPINNHYELKQIFDSITYYKGYYLLRMLNHTLGESTFLKACSQYLKQHKFGAVEQHNLWEAMNQQAHEDGVLDSQLDLSELMATWTSEPGFPVINVTRNYSANTASITQMRYEHPKEDVEAREQLTKWWVPLTFTTQKSANFNSTQPKLWLRPDDDETLLTGTELDSLGPEHWIIFNVQATGLYRVNYDKKNWKLISKNLDSKHYTNFAVLNRAQLLDDALDLARIGLLPYSVALNISSYLRREMDYLPWKSALSNLGYISRMLRHTDGLPLYKKYIQHLLEPQLISMGFELNKNDSYLRSLHHKIVLKWSCYTDHHLCVNKAISLFKTWIESKQNPIPTILRSVIYCTAVNHGGMSQWQFLWSQYLNQSVVSERNNILNALGCSQDLEVLKRYLEWTIEKESGIKQGDTLNVFNAVASSSIGFNIAKKFFFDNINYIENNLGQFQLSTMLETISSRMNQEIHLNELEAFENRHSVKFRHFSLPLRQANERVKYNIQWLQKNYNEIFTWLQQRVAEYSNTVTQVL